MQWVWAGGAGMGTVLHAVCGSAASLLGPTPALKALEDTTQPRLVGDALGVLELLDARQPAVSVLHDALRDQATAHGSGTTQLLALVGAMCAQVERLQKLGLTAHAIAQGLGEAAARCCASAEALALPIDELPVAGATPADGGLREPALAAGARDGEGLEMRGDVHPDEVGWFFSTGEQPACGAPTRATEPVEHTTAILRCIGGSRGLCGGAKSALRCAAAGLHHGANKLTPLPGSLLCYHVERGDVVARPARNDGARPCCC